MAFSDVPFFPSSQGDFNYDGVVNGLDYGMLSSNFGTHKKGDITDK